MTADLSITTGGGTPSFGPGGPPPRNRRAHSRRADTASEYSYHNAATCPDCGQGMVRLGGCFSCPVCGFSSCGL